jgi:predicted Zn-dependent protease
VTKSTTRCILYDRDATRARRSQEEDRMTLSNRKPIALVAIALLLLLLVACATSPTGRRQVILMSAPEMSAMGVAAFDEMKANTPTSTNATQRALVQCVADALTGVLTYEDLSAVGTQDWEVELFEDPTANAFALPGGKMGVNTGLLEVAKTPAQLAAVMGHEIGHVLAQHGNERVSNTQIAQMGMSAAAVIAGEPTPQKQQLMEALGVGTQLGLMKFSRTHESEADHIGLNLMARAGFDPSEAIKLWQNMSMASGGQAPPEFMSTHPSHATRISDLRAELPEAEALYQKAIAAGRRPSCR